MTNNVIRMDVDAPTCHKNNRSDDELRCLHPRRGVELRIILRGQMEEPVTLDITVDEVPRHGEQHDNQWHLTIPFQQEREDERALHVMELKQQKEHPIRSIHRHAVILRKGLEIEVQHYKEHRALHQQPAHFVVNRRTPFLGTHLTVTGIHKIKGHKYHQTYQEHNVQQVIKKLN